ncbi:MAG: hypothetical protein ACI4S4_03785, partial [Candidatus Ornithospirochaeta sp.]
MKDIDLEYICRTTANLSGVPIRIFKGDRKVFSYSSARLPKDPMDPYREEIWRVTKNVGYFVTEHFHYYGIVNSGETKIVIGPSWQVAENDQKLRELGFNSGISREDMEEFVRGMNSIACMPLETIMQMLCTINYILNDEKLELED